MYSCWTHLMHLCLFLLVTNFLRSKIHLHGLCFCSCPIFIRAAHIDDIIISKTAITCIYIGTQHTCTSRTQTYTINNDEQFYIYFSTFPCHRRAEWSKFNCLAFTYNKFHVMIKKTASLYLSALNSIMLGNIKEV